MPRASATPGPPASNSSRPCAGRRTAASPPGPTSPTRPRRSTGGLFVCLRCGGDREHQAFPSLKYWVISTDGGRTFTAPRPLTYEDRVTREIVLTLPEQPRTDWQDFTADCYRYRVGVA